MQFPSAAVIRRVGVSSSGWSSGGAAFSSFPFFPFFPGSFTTAEGDRAAG